MLTRLWLLPLALVACTGVKPIDTTIGGDDTGGTTFGSLYLDPSSVEFGSVGIGETAVTDVVLSNGGTDTLTVTDALVSGDATFSIQTALSLPMELESGGDTVLTLGFEPEEAVYYYGTLRVAVDGEDGYGEVTLTGAGVEGGTDSGGGSGGGDDSGGGSGGGSSGALSVSRTSIDFGEVDVWEPQSVDVDLTNTGDEDLLILDAASSDAEFEVEGDGFDLPAVLGAGDTRTISVTYAPEEDGHDSGSIEISTDTDGVGATIAVSGDGFLSCSICQPVITVNTGGTDDTAMSFFWLIATDGYSSTQPLTIRNDGDEPLIISAMALTNDVIATCGDFSTDFSGAVTLGEGESTTVGITYAATESCLDLPSTTFDTNILHIASNDPSEPDYAVSLSATVL